MPAVESEEIKPILAIVDENTLEAVGLKSLIAVMSSYADIRMYASFEQMQEDLSKIVHYFISVKVLFGHKEFFLPLSNRVIVLSCGPSPYIPHSEFNVIDISLPEKELLKAILRVHQIGHNLSAHRHPQTLPEDALSTREKEILRMIVMGLRNKEIADKCFISVTTVLTHRRNIIRKLSCKSLPRLTLYAVMNNIIKIEEI